MSQMAAHFVAACPDCGFQQPCASLGTALATANAHNPNCREQRKRREEWFDRPRELYRPWVYREPRESAAW